MKKEEFMKQFASQKKQQELILNKMREMMSSKKTNEDEFKKLVESMEDINYDNGRALIYAVTYNRVGYAKLLIEAGADVNVIVNLGSGNYMDGRTIQLTPLNRMVNGNGKISIKYFEMVELLLDAGADISKDMQPKIEELYLAKQLSDAQ